MEIFSRFFFFGIIILLAILVYVVLDRTERLKRTSSSLNRLVYAFNDLDEQAKLIIKTDLELNKAQEELDKRIAGLDALHQISRLINMTLDENEIFQRLNQPFLKEIGFEKFLFCTLNKEERFVGRLMYLFSAEEAQHILAQLPQDPLFQKAVSESTPIASPTLSGPERKTLEKILRLAHFVISPITAQKKLLGFVVAGNVSIHASIHEGDEELLAILCDQIGQAVENARLFEDLYLARHGLESKVQERTKQLSSALEEVQHINKMKSEFISAVSHELRTPLTSIKGYASILMAGKVGDIPPAVKERLEKINKHSDSLVKLINDLLDISRMESGRAEMNLENKKISSVIETARDLLVPQMKEKNIHFGVRLPEDLPAVPMDTGQIERVLINLLGNAIKFTPLEGTVSISAQYDEKEITVTVSDTGIGIGEKDAEKLFDEFYRVDNVINQNIKGTGLGLALVKKIIQAHNGQIWVTSKPKEGAHFSFTLPREQKQKPAKTAG